MCESVQKKLKKVLTLPKGSAIVRLHTVNTNYKNMRTKTLICAAALAAGALTSWAQSNVYSLNVVGYVNTTLPGNSAITMIGNPLNNTSGGNNISNLFTEPAIGDGAVIQRWIAA